VAGAKAQHDNISTGGTQAFGSSLTAGDTILIIVLTYGSNSDTINTPTESTGTATLGTVTLDESSGVQNGTSEANIYHANVTGSGTCTIKITGIWNTGSAYLILDEFSGMASSPVYGTPVTAASGSSGTENPGTITTPNGGMAVMAWSDSSGGSAGSYTITGTNIENEPDPSNVTGGAQYTLTTTGGSQTLTALAVSPLTVSAWVASGVAYSPASPTTTYSVIHGMSTIHGLSTIH